MCAWSHTMMQNVKKNSNYVLLCCNKYHDRKQIWGEKCLYFTVHHWKKSWQKSACKKKNNNNKASRNSRGTLITGLFNGVCGMPYTYSLGPLARAWHCPQWAWTLSYSSRKGRWLYFLSSCQKLAVIDVKSSNAMLCGCRSKNLKIEEKLKFYSHAGFPVSAALKVCDEVRADCAYW